MDEDGAPVTPEDARARVLRREEIVGRRALAQGGTREDVLGARSFVTCIGRADDGRAHREFFRDHAPCSTMVELARLLSPDFLVEVEVEVEAGALSGQPWPRGTTTTARPPTPSITSRTRISVSAASSASPWGAHVQAPELSE